MSPFQKISIFLTALFCSLFFAGPSWAAGYVVGSVKVQGLRSPANIAVYLEAPPGKSFPAPSHVVAIDQKKMEFVPHVTVVQQGTTVEFLNDDPANHNVFWPSVGGDKKLAHNLGTFPQGQKRSFKFDHLGDVPLLCNVHPEMSGYIVVVSSPYFAVTDSDGEFRITNVAPGQYTLKTWSEEGKPTSQTIEVTNATTHVNLTVTK